ncbi:MAG: IS110 family transposase [Streptosporangiaceae bacterium]|jgi:transposase
MGSARARRIPAQLVEDEEYQLRHERVAGIDVAKASAVVCTRLPPVREGGRRVSRVEEVAATVPEVAALAVRLLADGVQAVVMESTSDYWRVWYYVLEAHGLAVTLANSSQARQLAGRPKTDRLDAQWLARLAEMGLLRPSFVPPAEIRALREYTRGRLHLVHDRTRAWQRLEKLLEGALVKLTSVTSVKTKTARLIIRAMIAGQRDPRALAALAEGSLRGRQGDLEASLTGMMFTESHAHMAKTLLDLISYLDEDISILEARIAACLEAIPAAWGTDRDGVTGPGAGPDAAVLSAAERLAEIPGVSPELAMAIIAEVGLDMSRFKTAGHLASWAGLAPVASQSGPRSRKPKKGQGDSYLRGFCTQAANGAGQTDTFLGERLRRIARRRGGARARCAVGRSILIIIWHLLKDPEARFADLGPDHHARKTDKDKKILGHLRQLRALGVEVTVTERAA